MSRRCKVDGRVCLHTSLPRSFQQFFLIHPSGRAENKTNTSHPLDWLASVAATLTVCACVFETRRSILNDSMNYRFLHSPTTEARFQVLTQSNFVKTIVRLPSMLLIEPLIMPKKTVTRLVFRKVCYFQSRLISELITNIN